MLRKLATAVAVTALVSLAVPAAAFAEDDYVPVSPSAATLAGSAVDPSCGDGNATITYSVDLTDPNKTATGNTANLVLTKGSDSTVIALGTLVNNHLEGSVPWPTASWTRSGNISAQLQAGGASVAVPLEYEPATVATCAQTASTGTVGSVASVSSSLATTGMNGAVLPIGIAGGILALLGVVVLLARRFARR